MLYIRHLLACIVVTDVSYQIRKELPELDHFVDAVPAFA